MRSDPLSFLPCSFFLGAGLLLSGCSRTQIEAYRVPKDDGAPPAAEAAAPAPAATASGEPAPGGSDLVWTAPPAWKAKPLSTLRKASYDADGPDGPADVSVIAFPGTGGDDLANVNRWRGQVQLAPIGPEALAGDSFTIESRAGRLLAVDVNGAAAAGKPAQRLIGALLREPGQTWFFKIMGPSASVGAQREAFLAFVKSVGPSGSSGAAAVSADQPALPLGHPGSGDALMGSMPVQVDHSAASLRWQAPPDWREGQASAMRKGTYLVGSDGAATVAISAFPGDVGGVMPNVNRWRSQVGLPPLGDADVAGATDTFVSHGLQFVVADAAGVTPAGRQRIVAALVPWQEGTWFFKLTGPEDAVARAKDEFIAFLKTVQAP